VQARQNGAVPRLRGLHVIVGSAERQDKSTILLGQLKFIQLNSRFDAKMGTIVPFAGA
jgi:hypothetical protein